MWVLAQQVFLALLPPLQERADAERWSAFATFLVIPNANLWFIYALPVFFIVAWSTRGLPAAVPIGAATVLAIAFGSEWLHTGTAWDKAAKYLVFFLLAARMSDVVRRAAPRIRFAWAALLVVAYGVAVAVVVHVGWMRVPGVLLALSVLAVTAGVAVAVVASRVAAFRLLAVLGGRTLPIYLVHTFPMIALAVSIRSTGAVVPDWIAAIAPIVLAVAAIAFALWLHRMLGGVPGVFTVPVASWIDHGAGSPSGPLRAAARRRD